MASIPRSCSTDDLSGTVDATHEWEDPMANWLSESPALMQPQPHRSARSWPSTPGHWEWSCSGWHLQRSMKGSSPANPHRHGSSKVHGQSSSSACPMNRASWPLCSAPNSLGFAHRIPRPSGLDRAPSATRGVGQPLPHSALLPYAREVSSRARYLGPELPYPHPRVWPQGLCFFNHHELSPTRRRTYGSRDVRAL
jgi:hypothetical protein